MNANPFAPRKYGELQAVTDRVYIFRNITNSSFVVGYRSVAVVDTQVNLPTAQELLRAIRSVTDKPIEFVVNTHYHWDHTNGNQLFKDQGATIVSSKLTKEFMTVRAPRQKEFLSGRGFQLGRDPLLPEMTFEGERALDIGGLSLRLFFAGSAETEDATAIYVPKEGVLMSGDTVMTGSFPIFGQPVWDEGLEGDKRWTQTLEKLMSLDPQHIIPGHGPLAHEAEVAFLMRIQKYFIQEVRRLVEKDYPLERVLKELEPKLPDWITGLPILWGTPRYAILRVYRGLTKKKNDPEPGWQQFKPSAVPQKDASAYIKGKPQETPEDFLAMAGEAAEGGDAALKLSILKKGSEVFPRSSDILTTYADALIDASRAEASVLEKGDFFSIARSCWDRVLSQDPEHAGALLGKGRYLTMMAYRGGDDPAEGMELLRKASELKNEGRSAAEAEFYLGMGYRRLGDEKSAKGRFGRALALDPSFMPAMLAGQS